MLHMLSAGSRLAVLFFPYYINMERMNEVGYLFTPVPYYWYCVIL